MKRRKLILHSFTLLVGANISSKAFSADTEVRAVPKPSPKKGDGEFVLYSSTDKQKDVITRLTEGLRNSVLAGKIFKIDEDVAIAGTIQVPASARIEGGDKWITQDKALTPLFVCDGPGVRRFENINCKGVGADYINNSGVYAAAGITARNGSSITVKNCRVLNFAGAGVRLMSGAMNCRIDECKITGPGKNYISPKIDNYGACVVIDGGVQSWVLNGCDLSLSAQGIVTGDDLADVQITRNHIHDIAGQHGAYIESVRNIEISENEFFNIPLQAMKIQIGSIRADSAERILIRGNRISHVGSHGLLLTNPVGGKARLHDFVIRDNKFQDIGESAISLNTCGDGLIESNEMMSVGRGLYVDSCRSLMVAKNNIRDASKEVVLGVNIKDSSFIQNNFYRSPASSNRGALGISFTGALTSGIALSQNNVDDAILNKFSTEKIDPSRFDLRNNNFSFSGK